MNKLLLVILVLGASALIYYVVAGNSSILPPEAEIDETIDYEMVKEGLQEQGRRTVYGSCNDIPNSSNCIDYVGSMWKDNNSAELNCGEDRNFSTNACPYSQLGGCQANGGTVMEIIAWVYEEGPGQYTEEAVADAAKACNSIPNGKWVTPESFLE